MPHTITGKIRKDVFTKTGSSAKGEWKMYAIELSESWKDKDGQRQYTNYRATVFGSSPAAIQYYDQVLVKDGCASFTCDTLQVNQREHNGTNYITLELVQPRLVFAQSQGAQQQAKPQPRPQQQPGKPASNSNEPPMDFTDDIPFAPIGLQYSSHAMHSL